MASAAEREFNCWHCDSFQATDPGAGKDGECRLKRPHQQWDETGGAKVVSWPPIADGDVTYCKEWTRTSREVPPLP